MNIHSVLLREVRVLDVITNTDKIANVVINQEGIRVIDFLDPNQSLSCDEIIEAQGLILAPGLVDLYSWVSEPGYEARETLVSLLKASLTGGFTRIAILPRSKPVIDNLSVLKAVINQVAIFSQEIEPLPEVKFWGALTLNLASQQMTELRELSSFVVGFSDGFPIDNLSLLKKIFEYARCLSKPIALVPSLSALRNNGVIREGVEAMAAGLPVNPEVSESVAIASILEIADSAKVPVHLMRVSTARGVELIANAKKNGLAVTASTSWMHLLFSTEDIITSYDPNLRLEPPLGNQTDKLALIAGLEKGVIDAIAVDHTPYTYEEKTVAFAESPPGVIGLQLILPLLWQHFVISGRWTPLQLWKFLCVSPQYCLHQKPLSLFNQNRHECILFDPNKSWVVSRENLNSTASNTPWLGKTIKGKVIRVWNNSLE
ncbi:MAG: dihydroorotase [Cyanobacteria bacterium J083]|nr:MAG: dihydroorotase [Cyanobacteria bacterium J083]